jgi:hypothetical protein
MGEDVFPMKPIIVVMLCAQVGVLLAITFSVAFGRPFRDRQRPVWPNLAICLFIVAASSLNIAGSHANAQGADILQFGAPVLIGMGLMCLLLIFRERGGHDRPL